MTQRPEKETGDRPTAAPQHSHVVAQWKHESPLLRCRVDPHGRFAFSTAEDRSIQRWELPSGKKTTFTAHDGWVWGIELFNDGETLVTGGTDGRLIWWPATAEKPSPTRVVEAHDGWIRYVTASPDDKRLATAGNDKKVRVWNASSGALEQELSGHTGDIYSTFFHPTEPQLLSGDLMGKIKQWALASGKEVRELDAASLHTYQGGQRVHYGGVRGMTLSPDGKFLAASGLHKATNPLGAVNEPIVLLFDWATGKLAHSCVTKDVKGGIAWRALFHPGGFLIAASGGSSGGYLLFWKIGEDESFHQLKFPNNARGFDLHPNGLELVTTHYDRYLRITRMEKKPEEKKPEEAKPAPEKKT